MTLLDHLRKLIPKREQERIRPDNLPIEGEMPDFSGITEWINSEPLTKESLKGKVVLVDFWTYSCINCIRTIPYVNEWHEKYADKGLVIIGIHTPEFEFERDTTNVRSEMERFGIKYPVAIDNNYEMWKAYKNNYWPSHYFIDSEGKIRFHHFGEGSYGHSEAVITALLKEAGAHDEGRATPSEVVNETHFDKIGSPETYLGYQRLEYLGSPERVRNNEVQTYSSIQDATLNIFYFEGQWKVEERFAVPISASAKIIYRVQSAKINLVMNGNGTPHRVRIRVDGKELSDDMIGSDVMNSEDGQIVVVDEGRLFNLVDTKSYKERVIELTFLDPGVEAYAFTFG